MSRSELPVPVQQLLKEHIRSIEQLEILLLLREGAEQMWSPAEVYQVVRSSERSVSGTLETLCRQGLVRRIEGPPVLYQFSPQTEQLRETLNELTRLYSERRVRIVEAIYSERPSEVDEFARAFRLRKDTDG